MATQEPSPRCADRISSTLKPAGLLMFSAAVAAFVFSACFHWLYSSSTITVAAFETPDGMSTPAARMQSLNRCNMNRLTLDHFPQRFQGCAASETVRDEFITRCHPAVAK